MPLTIVEDTARPIFPTDVSFGRPGGPRYNTKINIMENADETRNSFWPEPKYSWDVAYGVRKIAKIYALLKFFHACRAMRRPFRYKDWSDFKSCDLDATPNFTDQSIGPATAGQTSFPLKKTYDAGPYTTVLVIVKPKGDTIRIGVNGVEETTGWTINEHTGIVTRTVGLTEGDVVTWGGEFYRKCRFNTDYLPVEFAAWKAGRVECPVIHIKGT